MVGIAAKMYEARRTLKFLLPDQFHARCQHWQEIIKKVSAGKELSDLEAVIDMLRVIQPDGMAQLWLLAAYVEMIEPSTEGVPIESHQ